MKRTLWIAALLAVISVYSISEEYTVRKGDTLYSIAHEFGVRLDLLLSVNGIDDPTALGVGTVIVIPRFHEVTKGDTVWSISRLYQSTVDEIRKINDFGQSHVLMVGDLVTVPGLRPEFEESTFEGDNRFENPSESDSIDPNREADYAGSDTPGSGDQEGDTALRDPIDNEEGRDRVEGETAGDGGSSLGGLPFWPINGERIDIVGKMPGKEILGQPGDLVYAVSGGVVVWDAPNLNFGRAVIVESKEGYLYLYGTEVVAVEIGQRVTAGARIGALGVNPNTGEAKLFFTVFKNGEIIDPELAPRG